MSRYQTTSSPPKIPSLHLDKVAVSSSRKTKETTRRTEKTPKPETLKYTEPVLRSKKEPLVQPKNIKRNLPI